MTDTESLLKIYEKMLNEYKIRIIRKDGKTDYEKPTIKIKKIEIKNEKNRI